MDTPNRSTPILDVLKWAQTRPDIAPHAVIVGKWLWIIFPAKPAAETLATLKVAGFWFAKANDKRPAGWYHTGEQMRRRIKGGKVDPFATHDTARLSSVTLN